MLGDVEAARTSYTNGHAPEEPQINGHARPEAVGKRATRGTFAGWIPQPDTLKHVPALAVKSLPAVLLGTLLNILDGISCKSDSPDIHRFAHPLCVDGMIVFPAVGVFTGLGGVGVSMFFVSCVVLPDGYAIADRGFSAIVSQLVYSFGGSGFAGANGSMMIEVVVRPISLSYRTTPHTTHLAFLPHIGKRHRKPNRL